MSALYQSLKYGYKDKWGTVLALKVLTIKQSRKICKQKIPHDKGNVNRHIKYYGSTEDRDLCGNVRNIWELHHFRHCRNGSFISTSCTPVSHIYPTSPWPICHKKKRRGSGWRRHYTNYTNWAHNAVLMLYKEPTVGTTQWPTQEIYYQMVSCFLALWVIKGRPAVRSDCIWTGSFLVKPNRKEKAQYYSSFSVRKQRAK